MGRKNFGETLYIVFLVSGKRFLWCGGGDDGGENGRENGSDNGGEKSGDKLREIPVRCLKL